MLNLIVWMPHNRLNLPDRQTFSIVRYYSPAQSSLQWISLVAHNLKEGRKQACFDIPEHSQCLTLETSGLYCLRISNFMYIITHSINTLQKRLLNQWILSSLHYYSHHFLLLVYLCIQLYSHEKARKTEREKNINKISHQARSLSIPEFIHIYTFYSLNISQCKCLAIPLLSINKIRTG
jgi:hypothetical protein